MFRLEEFAKALASRSRSPATIRSLLRYHVASGRLQNLRRGLYATTRKALDPWHIASRLSSDAVIAYDGALAFHEIGGDDIGLSFLTRQQIRPFTFEEVFYKPVKAPAALGTHWRNDLVEVEHEGEIITVTSIERTLVDALDRIDLVRGDPHSDRWVDVLRRNFAWLELDMSRMVHHACALGSSVLAARLGFFLENLPGAKDSQLALLEKRRPRSPAYFDSSSRGETAVFLKRWNLVVPKPLWLRVARGAR